MYVWNWTYLKYFLTHKTISDILGGGATSPHSSVYPSGCLAGLLLVQNMGFWKKKRKIKSLINIEVPDGSIILNDAQSRSDCWGVSTAAVISWVKILKILNLKIFKF